MLLVAQVRRRGTVLVLAFGLALVLAIEIYIVVGYSGGNIRMVGQMANHRRAVYVGDSAFCELLARMRRSGWDARWFRGGPVASSGQPLFGGRVDSYVADAAGEARTAEVWVRVRLEQAEISMLWRVHFREDGLDLRRLVYPTFFTFLPPALPPPTGEPGDATLAEAARLQAEQRANASAARALAAEIATRADFASVADALGMVPEGVVSDARWGDVPGSQASYMRQVLAAPRPPVPPPPPPAPGGLAARFPTPVDLPGVIAAVFAELGLPPAGAPTPAHFADPAIAASAYTSAVSRAPTNVRDPRWELQVEDVKIYVVELAKQSARGCSSCGAALDVLIRYLAEVTAEEAARSGRAAPRAGDVSPYPYTDSGYSNALTHYREWWSQ